MAQWGLAQWLYREDWENKDRYSSSNFAFTSIETIRGRPPRLSHSSWAPWTGIVRTGIISTGAVTTWGLGCWTYTLIEIHKHFLHYFIWFVLNIVFNFPRYVRNQVSFFFLFLFLSFSKLRIFILRRLMYKAWKCWYFIFQQYYNYLQFSSPQSALLPSGEASMLVWMCDLDSLLPLLISHG